MASLGPLPSTPRLCALPAPGIYQFGLADHHGRCAHSCPGAAGVGSPGTPMQAFRSRDLRAWCLGTAHRVPGQGPASGSGSPAAFGGTQGLPGKQCLSELCGSPTFNPPPHVLELGKLRQEGARGCCSAVHSLPRLALSRDWGVRSPSTGRHPRLGALILTHPSPSGPSVACMGGARAREG